MKAARLSASGGRHGRDARGVAGRVCLLLTWALMVAGCSRLEGCAKPPSAAAVAPPTADQSTAVEMEYDLNALLAVANAEEGRIMFTQCRACHSLEPGARGGYGPNLYGVFSRPAGQGSFAYSDAFRRATFDWTPARLDDWLRDPGRFIQGSRMVFTPIVRPQDRANLITYLMQETDAPAAAYARSAALSTPTSTP